MRKTIGSPARPAISFNFINPREAQLMLLMATGGSMDDLSPEDLELWEPLLDSFKDFCLSI